MKSSQQSNQKQYADFLHKCLRKLPLYASKGVRLRPRPKPLQPPDQQNFTQPDQPPASSPTGS